MNRRVNYLDHAFQKLSFTLTQTHTSDTCFVWTNKVGGKICPPSLCGGFNPTSDQKLHLETGPLWVVIL